jgi:hypothetical protein
MSDNDMHIASGRILAPKLWDDERQYAKEMLEIDFKSVGYLLTAHAAGLVGCLTVLKDYDSSPHFKGVGTFIGLFGAGLILAVVTFMALSMHRNMWMTVFLEGRPKRDKSRLSRMSVEIPGILSCLCLVSAVLIIILKFVRL